MSKSPVMRALSMLLSICMVFGMIYLPANASTYDVANMTNAEVLNLCIELSSKGDEEALAAIEADLGAIRAAEVEALYAALNTDEPAAVADSTAKVTAYKQVSYATAKVVDAKYFEEIGTAADLEGAVALIQATGANGGLIEISAGTLYVTNRQDITMANLIIKGAGKTATTIAGDTAKFNNTTNGLANKNGLSSEFKTLLGLPAENLKVMDLTIDGTGCGHDFGLFSGGRADFKTVRINSGVSYLENVAIKGNKGRTNLMIGTSSTKSTVYATNISVAKAYTVYGDTEIASGSKLTAVNSVLGGTVVGSTENLGAGYYKLSYNGLVAYTTIPYAIECYKAGTFADMLASVCTNEGIAAGTSVAAAMTADLTTVLTGKTTLLYGYDCAEMKALAAEFKTALSGLSADTKVDVSACLEKLTEALAIANWHTADFAGVCTNCGAEGLKAPTVQVPAVDELVSDSHTEAEKEVIENVATEIKQNTALDEFIPTNLPENTTLSVLLTSMGVEDGTAYKLTFEVAPVDALGTTIQPNGKVTFRLPIPASVIKTHANVYHNGELMGIYEIEGDGNGKYVEVETESFSEFTVETVDAPVTSVEVDTLEELQNALAADNDLTIVITSTIVIPEGQTVTIDLNGKTVTVPEATKHIYALSNKGILTLKDSKGTGSISARGIYNGYDGVSTNNTVAGAKMIIESGKYIALDSDGGAAIFNCAELIVNGGTFEGDVTLNNRLRGVMTINNATVNGAGRYAVQNNGGKLTINNATVNGKFGCVGQWEPTSETVINGGYFAFTGIEGNTSNCYYVGAGQAQINDGTFKKIGDVDLTNEGAYTLSCQTDATVEINGGTFTSVYKTATGMFSGKGALSVKGGTYYNIDGTVCNVSDKVAEGYELGEDGKVIATKTYVAQIGEQKFETLEEALEAANGGEVEILCDITEELGSFANVTLITKVAGGVTITDTFDGWVGFDNVKLGAGVTLNAGNVFLSQGENVIEGTMVVSATFYHGYGAKTTVQNGGQIKIKGNTILRYNGSANAGIFVYGDNDASTVEYDCDGYIGAYSGTFYAKDANVEAGYILLTNTTDGSKYAAATMELDNTVVNVVGASNTSDRINMSGKVNLTLKNNAKIEDVRDMDISAGTELTLSVEEDCSISVKYPNIAADVPFVKVDNGDGTFGLAAAKTYAAQIGDQKFETLEEALEAAQAGETVELLGNVAISNNNAYGILLKKAITIDGNGYTITVADGYSNQYAMFYLYAVSGTVTIKDLTFDGVKAGAAIWAHDADLVIENCVFQNGEHAQVQGLVRTTCSNLIVRDSKFLNNTCNFVITFNFDAAESDTMLVENCEFVGNTVNDTAVIYYVEGASSTITGCTFENNTVTSASHGAVVYYSDGTNGTVTNNIFRNNTIKAGGARASVLALEAGTTATGNAFIGNSCASTASGTTYVATVLNKADADSAGVVLNGNYWDGGEPDVANSKGAPVALETYYTTFVDGVLGGETETAKPVAQIGEQKFASLQAAIEAAGTGDTIVLLADISLTEVLTIAADKNIVLDLAGFAITRTVSQTVSENTYLLINDGTLTITDSVGEGLIELTYTGEKVARTISTICNRGTLNIQGGTINNNPGANSISYAIDNNSTISNAVINITGGSVTGGAQAYCIRLYLNSTVYANELNMTGGSVQYVWAQNPNTYANKGSISMTGDAYAWYVYVSAVAGECNAQNIALNVEAGTCYYAPACGTLAEGYALKLVDGVYKIVPVAYVAQIGEQKFESLQAAIEAAGAGETIVLLADISLTEALTIAADKDIVLDLAGKVLSYASAEAKASAVITNKGKLTVKDSVGGGKITTSALNPDQSTVMPHYANNTISNLGQLIIDSGKIENTTNGVACYAIDNYNGSTLTVNNGEIVSVYSDAIRLFATDAAAATVIINGGTVGSIWAQDSSDGRKDTNYVLTVNGGTVGAIYVEPTYGAEVAIKGGEIEKVVIYDPENGNKHDSLYGIVTGGTFNAAMDEKLVADGFELVENENGTFGIEEVTFVEPTISVENGTIKLEGTLEGDWRVGIFYIGTNAIPENLTSGAAWNSLVGYGKMFAVNGANGYKVYANGANLPTLEQAGNWVLFVKYPVEVNGETVYKSQFISYVSEGSGSGDGEYQQPSVSVNENNEIVLTNPESIEKLFVFYVGDYVRDEYLSNAAWNDLVVEGKKYSAVNGANGYRATTDMNAKIDMKDCGNYVIFMRYVDEEGKTKIVCIQHTVEDNGPPTVSVNKSNQIIVTKPNEIEKIFVFYVGDYVRAEYISNAAWTDLVVEGKKYPAVNGKNGYQATTDMDVLPELTEAGNYVIFMRYVENGKTKVVAVEHTVEGEITPAYFAPEMSIENGQVKVNLHEDDTFQKAFVFYTGETTFTDYISGAAWTELVKEGKKYAVNGAAGYLSTTNIDNLPEVTEAGQYYIFVRYTDAGGATRTVAVPVVVE